jgi:hypothetical protein
MKVKIALLIGSDGKYSAQNLEHVDWGLLADDLMDWEAKPPADPEASAKYIIEVEVPVPSVSTVEGNAVPLESQTP